MQPVTAPGTLSGKFKLVVLLGTIATAVITVLAVVFPHAVTSEVAAAIAAAIATVVAAFGAFYGSPGQVIGAIPPEDQLQEAPLNLHADPDA